MRIGILTYNTNHLKTEQITLGLSLKKTYNFSFFAMPFIERKSRDVLFQHRPNQATGVHVSSLAKYLKSDFKLIQSADEIDDENIDYFIITGSNLLPEKFVGRTKGKVINAHPGIIPSVRGLDSFKWAIFDDQILGNTIHFIDKEADAGEIIASSHTPIFKNDGIKSVADRHYLIEIQMLVDFERYIKSSFIPDLGLIERPARLRMPKEKEQEMLNRFENYKNNIAI